MSRCCLLAGYPFLCIIIHEASTSTHSRGMCPGKATYGLPVPPRQHLALAQPFHTSLTRLTHDCLSLRLCHGRNNDNDPPSTKPLFRTCPCQPLQGATLRPCPQHTAYRRAESIIHQRRAPGTSVITPCSSGISISPSHRLHGLPEEFRINVEPRRKLLNV